MKAFYAAILIAVFVFAGWGDAKFIKKGKC